MTQGWQHFPNGSSSNRFQPVPCRPFAGNAIQAFGNGTDVGVWQPQPPLKPTMPDPGITRRVKDRTGNALDALPDFTKLDLDDNSLYHNCGTLQVRPLTDWGEGVRGRGLNQGSNQGSLGDDLLFGATSCVSTTVFRRIKAIFLKTSTK